MLKKLKTVPWLKPLYSAGLVTIGKIVSAVLSLAYMALAARALGAEEFGMLVLVHGVVFSMSQILRFQTWQAVIRYGTDALEEKNTGRLQRLIKFATGLDMAGAVIGLLLILLLIGPASQLLHIPADLHDEVRLYSFSILFMMTAGAPLGILRLLDKFELIGIQTTIAPAIRFAGTIVMWIVGAGLPGFLFVWFLGTVISRLVLLFFAWRELWRQKLFKGFFGRHSGQLKPEPGIWRFIMAHNLSRGLFISQSQIGLLMVGWLLGPASAGLFKVAQQFADVLIKPANKLLMPAIYPELAKLKNADDFRLRRQMIVHTGFLVACGAGVILAVLAIFGYGLIDILFGEEFLGAYTVMLWLAVAGLFTIMAFPLEPLLSSSGRVRYLVMSYGAGTVANIGLLFPLVFLFDLVGAGMASLAAVIVSTAMMTYFGSDLFFKRPGKKTPEVSYD